MSDILAATRAIYDAFGRGDVPAILENLTDDVRWEEWPDNFAQRAGVPWLQFQHGRESVIRFFQAVGTLTIHNFQVRGLFASDSQVIADVAIDFTAPNGKRYRDEELHFWTYAPDGRVSNFRHYVDTAKHIDAAGVRGTMES